MKGRRKKWEKDGRGENRREQKETEKRRGERKEGRIIVRARVGSQMAELLKEREMAELGPGMWAAVLPGSV